MVDKENLMEVSKPRPLQKRVSLDTKKFFSAVGKAVIKGVSGQWVDALAELPEAIAALGISENPQGRAWVLIRRALSHAVLILLQEYSEAHRLENLIDSVAVLHFA